MEARMELSHTQIVWIAYLFGSLIVFQFCMTFFNSPTYHYEDIDGSEELASLRFLRPTLPKYLTSRASYTFFLLTFLLYGFILYTLLGLVLPVLADLGLAPESASKPDSFGLEHSFLLAALIVAGLAPNTIGIRKLLLKAREWLHSRASIPLKGRNTYARLKGHHIVFNNTIKSDALNDKDYADPRAGKRIDLIAEDFDKSRGSIEREWATISYLVAAVKTWAKGKSYGRNLRRKELHWKSLEKNYKLLSEQIIVYRTDKMTDENRMYLRENLRGFLMQMRQMIACLLYMSEIKEKGIDERLQEIGLLPNRPELIKLRWRQSMLVVGGLLCAIVAAWGILLSMANFFDYIPWIVDAYKITTGSMIRVAFYALPFHGFAVFVTLMAKWVGSHHSDLWPATNPWVKNTKFTERPWHLYVPLSLIACVVSFVVLVFLQIIMNEISFGEINQFQRIKATLYWSSLAFVTAIFTAYRLDTSALHLRFPRKLVRWSIRIPRAAFQGFVLAGLTAFIYLHLYNHGSFSLSDLRGRELSQLLIGEEEGYDGMNRLTELMVFVVTAFLIGGALNLTSRFWSVNERRREGRTDVNFPVQIKYGEDQNEMMAKIRNISNSGARVTGNKLAVPDGAPIVIFAGRNLPEIAGRVLGQGPDQALRVFFDERETNDVVCRAIIGLNAERQAA